MQLKDKVYKLVTIRVGSDGSLYMGMPLGRKYSKQGLSAPKITYHPDGNMWVTSEIQSRYLSEKDAKSLPDGDWQGKGLSIKNKKVYVRGLNHTATTPLAHIGKLLSLNKGIQYFNLAKINPQEVFVEASNQKAQKAEIVVVDGYSDILVRFYLVHENLLSTVDELSGKCIS